MSMAAATGRARLIGVISDTHGLLRPEAIEALRGSELIIHAGDVGRANLLDALRTLAPTVAVRGNIDTGDVAATLAQMEVVEVGRVHLYILHDLSQLDLDPKAAGFAAVIFGHSHRPSAELRDGVLFLNPGSAGPRRFSLPISVARLRIVGERVSHEIVQLHV
jgi:putative phosphoesterase